MTRTRTTVLAATSFLLAGALALFLVLLTGRSSGSLTPAVLGAPKTAEVETPGLGPAGGYEAYLSAARTYPANVIPPSMVARAKATFNRIARGDARLAKRGRRFAWDDKEHLWKLYGPLKDAVEPGAISFTGATRTTASRLTALAVSPDCGKHGCRVWVGAAGGGVRTTANALTPNPAWHQISPEELDQNSVGTVVLDPRDHDHDTIYLGTGEPNRCSSGCEAGVGIYKTTDGGDHWKKLADTCVSNATHACVTPGKDAFLGRGISSIVIDPRNSRHILVGSAQAVRGLSHVIGAGGRTRLEPGANEPGVYESFDGGKTFTEVWNGSIPGSFGVTKVGLDPLDPDIVYASAFDAGLWRRDGATPRPACRTPCT